MEILEERFGEVLILVYGVLSAGGALSFRVDRAQIHRLTKYCDPVVEQVLGWVDGGDRWMDVW